MKPANTLEIKSLDGDWRDLDSVLVHAIFQIVENFIIEEKEAAEGSGRRLGWDRLGKFSRQN